MDSPSLIVQIIGVALGAAFGGLAAWVAIRVEVALAKQIAEDAKENSADAHRRITDHVERHHTVRT